MAGTKVQTSKVWKCPIFPDLARFSAKPVWRGSGPLWTTVNFHSNNKLLLKTYTKHVHNLLFTTCYIGYIAFAVLKLFLAQGWVEIIKRQQQQPFLTCSICSLQTCPKNDFLLNCHFTDNGPPFVVGAVRTPRKDYLHILADTDRKRTCWIIAAVPIKAWDWLICCRHSWLLVASGAQLARFPTFRSSRNAIFETSFDAEDERW